MRFRITSQINDGMAEAPPVEVELPDVSYDAGVIFCENVDAEELRALDRVGGTLLVERIG